MHIMLRRASQTIAANAACASYSPAPSCTRGPFSALHDSQDGTGDGVQVGGTGGREWGGLPRNWLSPAGHSAIQQSPARNSRPRKRANGLDLASSSDTM